jgi:hypothetical protein
MATVEAALVNNRFAVGLTLGLALAGCASLDAPTSGSEIERCRAVWAAADGIVADAGTGDAAAQPVAGHRYLRADRFLASFSDSIAGEAIISAWSTAWPRWAATRRVSRSVICPPRIAPALRTSPAPPSDGAPSPRSIIAAPSSGIPLSARRRTFASTITTAISNAWSGFIR